MPQWPKLLEQLLQVSCLLMSMLSICLSLVGSLLVLDSHQKATMGIEGLLRREDWKSSISQKPGDFVYADS